MSTCQGEQAGELQRKIAGTFQSLHNSESSAKALGGKNNWASLPAWHCPLSPNWRKDLKGTAIPRRLMRTSGSRFCTTCNQHFLLCALLCKTPSLN